jgi:hypothetical protein
MAYAASDAPIGDAADADGDFSFSKPYVLKPEP